EAIEAVDEGPLESASAAGAHKPQQVRSQHPRLSDPRCPGRRGDRIGITLVVIIVVTVIIDQILAWIRPRVIHGAPGKSEKDDDEAQNNPQPISPTAGEHKVTDTEKRSPRVPG